jgi:hypothetical protein
LDAKCTEDATVVSAALMKSLASSTEPCRRVRKKEKEEE